MLIILLLFTIQSKGSLLFNPSGIAFYSAAQEPAKIKLTGLVKDDMGEPLPYVSVGLVNEEIGTVTDTEGNFILLLNAGKEEGILRFSFIGYEPKELKLKNALAQFAKYKTSNMVLKASKKELKEVKVDAKRWITSVKGGKVGPGAKFNPAFMMNVKYQHEK